MGHGHDGVDVAFGLHDQHAPESRRVLVVGEEPGRVIVHRCSEQGRQRELVVSGHLGQVDGVIVALLELEDGELRIGGGGERYGNQNGHGSGTQGDQHQASQEHALHSFSPLPVVSDAHGERRTVGLDRL